MKRKSVFIRGFVSYLILSLVILSGCSSGPRATPIELPSAALENAMQKFEKNEPIEIADALPSEWWLLFDDSQLTTFIETAFKRNPTLQATYANILLAASNADRVGAALYPQLNWSGDIAREKISETGIIPFGTAPPGTSTNTVITNVPVPQSGIPAYFTQYESELGLTFDFDLWGKNRNTLRAAVGEMRAKAADHAFSRLQLGIALAQVYFRLQVDYRRQDLMLALVENKQKFLNLMNKRFRNNIENGIGISLAESNLADAKQILLQVQGDIAVREYQLKAYLAGDFQEEIEKIEVVEKPLPVVPLPEDLPLHLISQRPDITSQLWIIESAGRRIDVAKAGFYPDINLAAYFGYQTIHLHEFFNWKSSFYNINPAFSLPIFDGGRLIANLRGSEVNYDLAIFNYNQLVLNAAKEVLDSLALLRNNYKQLQQLQEKVSYQTKLSHLTGLRVQKQLNSSLDLLNVEYEVLRAQLQEAAAWGDTIQSMLSLIKAVGGGYVDCSPY